MNEHRQILNEAGIASRRFTKGTRCKILFGSVINYINQKGLIKGGLLIDPDIGYDQFSGKILVMPVDKWETFDRKWRSQTLTLPLSQQSETESDEQAISRLQRDQALDKFLSQSVILTTLGRDQIPGAVSDFRLQYDILVDGVDVNQAVAARPILKTSLSNTAANVRWNDR